jgi:glucosamine--fructose-6-phosphate aminotransferase (isomerizing)
MCAGPELSVAATKSYIASLAAITHLIANWAHDQELLAALDLLPQQLEDAWRLDWRMAIDALQSEPDMYVVGRGLGLGLAQEAALKLKETCQVHAEALSAAELRHGPMALVKPGFPVLLFAQDDETLGGVQALADELGARSAQVIVAGAPSSAALTLPTLRAHPATQPMLMAQSFYRLVNALAVSRGLDPDHPPLLRKITETV